MLNYLGANYQMFTTLTHRPPLPKYCEILSMLHSFEARILFASSSSVLSQVAFSATKAGKDKHVFTSEKKGFQGFTPIAVAQTSNTDSSNKNMSSSSTSGQTKKVLCTDDEMKFLLHSKSSSSSVSCLINLVIAHTSASKGIMLISGLPLLRVKPRLRNKQ